MSSFEDMTKWGRPRPASPLLQVHPWSYPHRPGVDQLLGYQNNENYVRLDLNSTIDDFLVHMCPVMLGLVCNDQFIEQDLHKARCRRCQIQHGPYSTFYQDLFDETARLEENPENDAEILERFCYDRQSIDSYLLWKYRKEEGVDEDTEEDTEEDLEDGFSERPGSTTPTSPTSQERRLWMNDARIWNGFGHDESEDDSEDESTEESAQQIVDAGETSGGESKEDYEDQSTKKSACEIVGIWKFGEGNSEQESEEDSENFQSAASDHSKSGFTTEEETKYATNGPFRPTWSRSLRHTPASATGKRRRAPYEESDTDDDPPPKRSRMVPIESIMSGVQSIERGGVQRPARGRKTTLSQQQSKNCIDHTNEPVIMFQDTEIIDYVYYDGAWRSMGKLDLTLQMWSDMTKGDKDTAILFENHTELLQPKPRIKALSHHTPSGGRRPLRGRAGSTRGAATLENLTENSQFNLYKDEGKQRGRDEQEAEENGALNRASGTTDVRRSKVRFHDGDKSKASLKFAPYSSSSISLARASTSANVSSPFGSATWTGDDDDDYDDDGGGERNGERYCTGGTRIQKDSESDEDFLPSKTRAATGGGRRRNTSSEQAVLPQSSTTVPNASIAQASTGTRRRPRRPAWSEDETNILIQEYQHHLQEERNRGLGEHQKLRDMRLHQKLARQIETRGVRRTAGAIKNHWTRVCRQMSGLDERTARKDGQARAMVTSAQSRRS
ncbi:hypothetical protein BP6252_02193 [Coleophoma cylindrospora]|uniref:Uncharacterized protein n=1 Tax=Coleophoma cylindrospora TaxID=1849047 RepID=A0A3D8SE56_9HELO|nr:hypothetical protein BP6252_02193 [Coleophoma cylindrospora]